MTKSAIVQKIALDAERTIEIETGKLATQADGSVVLKLGKTMLLATVVSSKEASDVDFFPLTVDYREKFSASGKFPGGFLKRETRPSDYEILISRLIDRALRPLFPDDYHAETQVLVSLLSADKEHAPDALACLAASAAIAVSDVPMLEPVSEVRVARINGVFQINPPLSLLPEADIDMIVAATEKNIMMVEGEMKEVSEEDMLAAIDFAHQSIKIQCQAQMVLANKVGKTEKRSYQHETNDEVLEKEVMEAVYTGCYNVAKQGLASKADRKEKFTAVYDAYAAKFSEEELAEKSSLIKKYFKKAEKKAVRDSVLNERIRLDGRKLDEIRPIWSEVDYLPSAHGSAIFTRGETQALASVTLGTKLDEQNVDGAYIKGTEKFMLHYNFPPFSTGEARFLRGTSRREVGHGNLALRALKPMIPSDFSYTIRIISDVLESNGSSSMATVCAGSLALMDAGVPLKKPVTGIAMGLITDNSEKYAVLSDILGDEDHLGDMDFKVTGTKDGITACQMDIKVDGLSAKVLTEALHQAKAGRLHILNEITGTLSESRSDYKPHTPRLVKLIIAKSQIGAVIGPGGKVIQEIQRETETTITIEEIGDTGSVEIFGQNKDAIESALQRIKLITATPEVGEIYEGKVKSVTSFGAFVEILPGKEGLLHISEIDHKRVEKVEDEINSGDQVKVKLIGVDPKTGKLRLSRKALMEKEVVE